MRAGVASFFLLMAAVAPVLADALPGFGTSAVVTFDTRDVMETAAGQSAVVTFDTRAVDGLKSWAESGDTGLDTGGRIYPVIRTVSPATIVGSNQKQWFTVHGSNFASGCTVTLRDKRTGEVFPNRTIVSQGSTYLSLRPNFAATAAQWSAEVINPGSLSSGQYVFDVTAPSAPASITGISALTSGSQGTPQTITITGSNFTAGSQMRIQSLTAGSTAMVSATVLNSSLLVFDYSFATSGQCSITVVDSNNEPSQPTQGTVSGAIKLRFPLNGVTPYSARMSAMFDHKMKTKFVAGTVAGGDVGITTFLDEHATITTGTAIKGTSLYSFRSDDGKPLLASTGYDGGSIAWYDSHNGYDYPGVDGVTEVHAAASGTASTVNDKNPDDPNGYYIAIDHAGGYRTLYCHLHEPDQKVIDNHQISEGQLLGTTGTTGHSDGPHLHFTVKRMVGNAYVDVDPYGWTSATGKGDPYIELQKLQGKFKNECLWRDNPPPKATLKKTPNFSAQASLKTSGFSAHAANAADDEGTSSIAFSLSATGTAALHATIDAGPQTYSATATEPWLNILSGASGTGTSDIAFSVATNTGAKRTAEITIQIPIGGPLRIVVEQDAAAPGLNPTAEEVAARINVMAKKYRIPSPLIAAVAFKESAWQQFDSNGTPVTVPTTGGIGIMQIHVENPAVPMDAARVGSDWIYNMETGCRVLVAGWDAMRKKPPGPYGRPEDNNPAILENWFYPVAWYDGEGSAAYAYIGAVWNLIKAPPAPVSDYFAAVPDLGDPRGLYAFPQMIYTSYYNSSLLGAGINNLQVHGYYSLSLLKRNGAAIHLWNWDANAAGQGLAATPESAVDVTESIGTEPYVASYAEWAASIGADESQVPEADPDGDGVPNILEYVLGGDPNDPMFAPRPAAFTSGSNFVMTATVAKTAKDVSLHLETSTDLVTWVPANVSPLVAAETEVWQTLQWAVPMQATRQFFRLSTGEKQAAVQFSTWQTQHFTPEELMNPQVSGPDATPLGDGVPNLLKYAFGLSPWESNTAVLPHPVVLTDGTSGNLAFKYRELIGAGNLTYIVGVSDDLQKWDWSESQIEQVGLGVPTGDGLTQEITIRLSMPIESLPARKFLRLQVTQAQ